MIVPTVSSQAGLSVVGPAVVGPAVVTSSQVPHDLGHWIAKYDAQVFPLVIMWNVMAVSQVEVVMTPQIKKIRIPLS